jgi:hypothetical protein
VALSLTYGLDNYMGIEHKREERVKLTQRSCLLYENKTPQWKSRRDVTN